MARPPKDGLEYFPLDVELDDKFDVIEARFGLEGFAILVKLYQRIYANGYFYPWTTREHLLFSKRAAAAAGTVTAVVREAVSVGIFSGSHLDAYRILTSRGIQKRYFAATYRRRSLSINPRYLLVSVPEDSVHHHVIIEPADSYPNESGSAVLDGKNASEGVGDDADPVSGGVFAGNNPQSKGKESKGKNTPPSAAAFAAPRELLTPLDETDSDATAPVSGEPIGLLEAGGALEAELWEWFVDQQTDRRFKNYPKERVALKSLVREATARRAQDPRAFLRDLVIAFTTLKRTESGIRLRPLTPATLNTGWIFEMCVELMAVKSGRASADWVDEYLGGQERNGR